MQLENGKTYLVKCRRKGTFVMRVDGQDKEWAHGVVVGGKARAMLDYNERTAGDEITVRLSFLESAVVQP